MKLLLIRHGDPDYSIDSLTEKGWREAELLAELLNKQYDEHLSSQGAGLPADKASRLEAELNSGRIDSRKTGDDSAFCTGQITKPGEWYFYMSPYGRAKDTASLTLKKLGRTAEVMPWLREFDAFVYRPDDPIRKHVPWDWLPQDWTADPRFYQKDHWFENEYLAAYNVGEEYCKVTEQFDELLAKHGYRREGRYYRVERSSKDTIVLFCHFGVGAVLLSHIWGISPVPVWHGFCAPPSSVTTLVTEERRQGIATFRMQAYGETTHLYMNEEPPAFAARFCECFEESTRHD